MQNCLWIFYVRGLNDIEIEKCHKNQSIKKIITNQSNFITVIFVHHYLILKKQISDFFKFANKLRKVSYP